MGLAYQIYRAKYRYGKNLPLTTPVDVSLELASKCNMRCGYCYHNQKDTLPFQMGIMSFDTAALILHDAADSGVHSLKFNWKGESTMNPEYTRITKLAKDLAKKSTFIDRLANSNFKIPKSIREDRFSGLANLTKVKISYDSFRKDVFEKQRLGGNHDLTTENIHLFYNHPERIKSETQMVIQAVRTNLNKDEDIFHECKKRWPEADISIRDMVEGRVEKDLDDLAHKKRDSSVRQSCLQAHVRIIFNWKGDAYPCCPDIGEKLNLGSIWNSTISGIFNSQHSRELRKSLKSKKAFEKDPCKSCSSFETYKGYRPTWHS